jgi:excisionase family DNA binding protein
MPATDPENMRPSEAAEHLKVSIDTLNRWAEAGYITHVRLPSGHRRYRLDDLNKARTIIQARTPR